MTFPDVPTTIGPRLLKGSQADTSATRTFPNPTTLVASAGDLLIAIIAVYQSSAGNGAAFTGWTQGFTEKADVTSGTTNIAFGVAYKWATGPETVALQVTQSGTITGHATMLLLSIPNASPTVPPEVGPYTAGVGSVTFAGLSPSWGAQDTLWMGVFASAETSTAGSFTGAAAINLTNYTDVQATTISADVVGGINMGISFRQFNTATESPDPPGVDTSNARAASILIAVPPVISAGPPPFEGWGVPI